MNRPEHSTSSPRRAQPSQGQSSNPEKLMRDAVITLDERRRSPGSSASNEAKPLHTDLRQMGYYGPVRCANIFAAFYPSGSSPSNTQRSDKSSNILAGPRRWFDLSRIIRRGSNDDDDDDPTSPAPIAPRPRPPILTDTRELAAA